MLDETARRALARPETLDPTRSAFAWLVVTLTGAGDLAAIWGGFIPLRLSAELTGAVLAPVAIAPSSGAASEKAAKATIEFIDSTVVRRGPSTSRWSRARCIGFAAPCVT